MKKLLSMLVVLFVIYFGIQILFNILGKGEEIDYQLKDGEYTIEVHEKSTFKIANNADNYYFNVKVDDTEFNFQLYNDFSKNQKVISGIKYFKNEKYQCIVPIFKKNKILMDAICLNNGVYTYANQLNDKEINEFTREVKGYDLTKYQDREDITELSNIKINKYNLFNDIFIAFNSYRGVNTISNNFNKLHYNLEVFNKDVYDHKIATFVDNYYIVANYNDDYTFSSFKVIDIVKLKDETLSCHTKISFDSYIQGVVDGKVYLYDKENKKQYEINVEKNTISEITSSNSVKYYDNEWTTITLNEANQGKLFVNNHNDYENNEYSRIDKVGNETGYYYLYKKVNDAYRVYRKNIQDDKLFYLFNTSTIDNIMYVGNDIYYIDNNTLKTYSDSYGNRVVLTYDELSFNKNIHLTVYKRG